MSKVPKEIVDKLCPTFQSGPLDNYRQSATFCWRQLKVKVHSEEALSLKMKLWKLMENDPLFARNPETETLDQIRQKTFRRVKKLQEWKIPYQRSVESGLAFIAAVGMYDWSLCARKFLLSDFIVMNLLGSGTKFHHETYLQKFREGEFTGCFCLTEMSHGSNSKGVRTTATYIKEADQFEIHTPDFEAAKTWSGNLAESATHASVFAQLYTVDNSGQKTSHGLHNFIVPIRDPSSLEPYPGLIIGDIGEKLGLNGIDNGFMMFNKYRVSRNSLLNSTGGIDSNGNYVTPYKDPSKRFGASLGNLSGGRVGIVTMATANLHAATVIGIRYSVARKQFGPDDEPTAPELSVIEYQTQQCRLLPYLAASFVIHHFGISLGRDMLQFNLSKMTKQDGATVAAMGREIHGLSCAAKPMASWIARDAIQEVREACGGHGYLKAGNLGRLRDDNDANCTYEGDNNVILQQTSNWLIGVWKILSAGRKVETPFGSLHFLNFRDELLQKSFNRLETDLESVVTILHTLVTKLIKCTHDKVTAMLKKGKTEFESRNSSQFFLARDLSLAFIETTALQRFIRHVNDEGIYDKNEQTVMNDLAYLFGMVTLLKYTPHLMRLGIFESGSVIDSIHLEILSACSRLKPNALALADVLAPPDFILNSILGHSSGEIYKQIQKSVFTSVNSFQKAKYWEEITEKFRSKL